MLLDELLPDYDFTEVHTIRIVADPETAYRAIMETTPAEISSIMRLLFFLRELPEKAAGRKTTAIDNREPMLASMLNNGFTKLAENKPGEIVFGLIVPEKIGRVWRQSSNLNIPVSDAKAFFALNDPDCLQVVANLLIEENNEQGFVTIRTESRTRALSRHARRNFTPYWRIIRPFSGLIRRLWLRGIKRHAEQYLAGIPDHQQEYSK
ncbi:MAG: hypothetical protein P8105_12230 [Dehalococcoidia bacterium]